MIYIGVAIVLIAAPWWFSRLNELFCVSVRDGRLLLVRGRVPPSLLNDFRDVVAQPVVRRATIRARRDRTGARLVVAGISDKGQQQRLRNVFSLCPVSRLRSAPASLNRTLGQVLGIVWLAWLLDRTFRP